MSNTPGRNELCPCGSGLKYKHCCEDKVAWHDNPILMGAGVLLLIVLGIVLASVVFSGSGESTRECPPGQVWSAEHGHCH